MCLHWVFLSGAHSMLTAERLLLIQSYCTTVPLVQFPTSVRYTDTEKQSEFTASVDHSPHDRKARFFLCNKDQCLVSLAGEFKSCPGPALKLSVHLVSQGHV